MTFSDVIFISTPKNAYLKPILATVPFHRSSEVLHIGVNPIKACELFFVTGENDLVLSSNIDSDAIIGEGIRRMEVEDEEKAASFENYNLIAFMF